jgi:hypothetical protein
LDHSLQSSHRGKVLGRSFAFTTVVMLELTLRAHAALFGAHGAHPNPPTVESNSVALVLHILTARVALFAFGAQEPSHSWDWLSEDPATSSSCDFTLVDAVQCALVHYDDSSAAHNLKIHRADKFPCLEHTLA